MPLYATNGRVQDLPANTQFLFWDNQLDWGRAYKIAHIEQQHTWGAEYGFDTNEMYINLLMDVVSTDPCKTFISRPSFQSVDWEQWGAFCRWVFSHNILQVETLLTQIKYGNCGYWLGQFLASKSKAVGSYCYQNNSTVDNTKYWGPHFKFDPHKCQSVSELPDHWPTPDEIALGEAYARWWGDILGNDQVQSQKFASQSTKQPPPIIEQEGEVVVGDKKDSKVEDGLPWGVIALGVFTVGLVATLIVWADLESKDEGPIIVRG